MRRLILAPNIPARNDLPIAFKATYETKLLIMELSQLFAEVVGREEPLSTSATIRACIHFTHSRRKAIMMARLREQRKREREQCQQNNTTTTATDNSSSNPELR